VPTLPVEVWRNVLGKCGHSSLGQYIILSESAVICVFLGESHLHDLKNRLMNRFMASKNDDVTLPFSVLDAIVGDVYSVLWEPDMMAEMGSALKILTSEVLTSGVQQVLAATAMTALMSAIQWPIRESSRGCRADGSLDQAWLSNR